jgi:chromosome segregation ATPase
MHNQESSQRIKKLELERDQLTSEIDRIKQDKIKLEQDNRSCNDHLKDYKIQANYYKENLNCIQKKRDEKLAQIRELEEDIQIMKKQVENIANTKPYRIAYLLRRFILEFIKGNIQDKKNFIKWLLNRSPRKETEHKYNPLMEIAKK